MHSSYFDHSPTHHFPGFQDRFDSILMVHKMTVQEPNEETGYTMDHTKTLLEIPQHHPDQNIPKRTLFLFSVHSSCKDLPDWYHRNPKLIVLVSPFVVIDPLIESFDVFVLILLIHLYSFQYHQVLHSCLYQSNLREEEGRKHQLF